MTANVLHSKGSEGREIGDGEDNWKKKDDNDDDGDKEKKRDNLLLDGRHFDGISNS